MNAKRIFQTVLISLFLIQAILTLSGCPGNVENADNADNIPDNSSRPSETEEPFRIRVEMAGLDEPVRSVEISPQTAPDDLLVSVFVENPMLPDNAVYDLDFVYQAMTFRGVKTFLRENPNDPESGYVSDADGPMQYHILEPIEGRIENNDLIGEQKLDFYIVPPDNTLVIKYWVEVTIKKG
ncbi:MAG TPA: hypothetical protein ENN67_01570, partial [Firmicutes bacterium]|nr:hypothetical protein [Bacillota bacterium]